METQKTLNYKKKKYSERRIEQEELHSLTSDYTTKLQ